MILFELVSHALELPLHRIMPRLETMWYIDLYGKRQDMNPTWLELAKLDFNVVQSTHLEDLKHSSRLNYSVAMFLSRCNAICTKLVLRRKKLVDI
ncbi:hypothetical protein TIFTF001_050089 [Ficus carica]|uniref:Uncharacterized protein n=1 Tax=Ficus carica TaxID=3494 RepID=A0AA87YRJ5_FICCA|nr:hypothetical protein TIFTF001_050089 [Ficus carica]